MSRRENQLIVIEKGQLTNYQLDNKISWEIGRPSNNSAPDIKLYSDTTSRKHGRLQNLDGLWFYLDYNGKNGTVYNKSHVTPGLNGKIKPIMLNDGDILVFGGGEKEVINYKTVWAMFSTKGFEDNWRVADTKDCSIIRFTNGEKTTVLNNPSRGTVLNLNDGIAIYMGDLSYLIGNVEMCIDR